MSCPIRPDYQTGFRLGGETAAVISLPNRPCCLLWVAADRLTDHGLEGVTLNPGTDNKSCCCWWKAIMKFPGYNLISELENTR